jgi:hypothetical protein
MIQDRLWAVVLIRMMATLQIGFGSYHGSLGVLVGLGVVNQYIGIDNRVTSLIGALPWFLLAGAGVGLFRLRWWGAGISLWMVWCATGGIVLMNLLWLAFNCTHSSNETFWNSEFVALFLPTLTAAVIQTVAVGSASRHLEFRW